MLDLNPQAQATKARVPGQLKQQLQLIQEAQEENERLRGFMATYMSQSDKVG